jgi:3-hydroxyisobutyrate dehydrogenase-like beta-hydroxyacid dehydrogenase
MTAVAILGTGRMGSAMARALSRAGHELTLWNRTPDAARSLAGELRARVADTPADAVRHVDVAISMLADRAAVEATCGGRSGAIAGVHPGLVLVDMSTVEPEVSQTLEPQVRAAGGDLLDAPVSGSVSLAESGQLTIMVGGDAQALERARPALEAVAARIVHVGPIGAGAAMKLATNAVIFALDVGLSEALVLAERAGIEREVAYEVLASSAAGAPFVGYKRAAFLEPHATPTAFSVDLAAKDLRLIDELARAFGLPLAQARVNREVIGALAETGQGERDFSWVAEDLRARTSAATTTSGNGRFEEKGAS